MMRLRHARRGFTLIELVVVLGAMTILLGLSATLIHALMRVHRGAQSHQAETRTIGRLALQFRRDAHEATGAKALDGEPGSAPGLELTLAGGRSVVYRAIPRGLGRTKSGPDGPPRRESFFLTSRSVGGLSASEDGGKTWAVLVLAPRAASPGEGKGPGVIRIEGLVAGDGPIRTVERRGP